MGAAREAAARYILLSLGLLGRPEQVRLLLYVLEARGVFTAPELVEACVLPRGRVYPFVAGLQRRGVIVRAPRPAEPAEWVEVYGRGVLARRRRELHVTGAAPLLLDRGKLRELAERGGCGAEALWVLEVGLAG